MLSPVEMQKIKKLVLKPIIHLVVKTAHDSVKLHKSPVLKFKLNLDAGLIQYGMQIK